ncbi:MAG: hypothetical protein K8T25_15885 [Planctomycetia bacterium]|nr:hypothetical protein [Planctomycetia bacterium]
MYDLLAGGLVLAAVCAGLFFGCWRLALRRPRWVSLGLAGGSVLFVCLYGWFVHGKLLVTSVLPLSNAILLGNGIALALAALAGVMAGQSCVPRWRRWPFLIGLLGLGVYSVACNFIGPAVSANDAWTPDGICLQSCPASCSPASAATLLRLHGLAATEQEMIGLCLTSEWGTPSLGLYRGLKIKTAGTPWRIELVRGTVDDLLSSRAGPVLLRIRLEATDDPAEGRWPWSQGIGHAVVLFGVDTSGRVEVGDPALGRDRWTRQDLKTRWRGEGLRLVRREGN